MKTFFKITATLVFGSIVGVLGILLIAAALGGTPEYDKDMFVPQSPVTVEDTDTKQAVPEQKATKNQINAYRSAESYLDFMGYSKKGLIRQLTSDAGEGFAKKDATWAVNRIKVDWNEQAVRSAESYLQTQPFSRKGLIRQLSSEYGDNYTVKQATYAADKVGL